jgi:hypothetical protein
MAVVIEVANSDCPPVRSGVAANRPFGDNIVPVHFPDRRLAVNVLPQDVGMAVVIEIADSDLSPTWPRIGADRCMAGDIGPVQFPDRSPPVGVLPQDVG